MGRGPWSRMLPCRWHPAHPRGLLQLLPRPCPSPAQIPATRDMDLPCALVPLPAVYRPGPERNLITARSLRVGWGLRVPRPGTGAGRRSAPWREASCLLRAPAQETTLVVHTHIEKPESLFPLIVCETSACAPWCLGDRG